MPNVMEVRGQLAFRSWLMEQGYSPRTCYLYPQIAARAEQHTGPLDVATIESLRTFWVTVPPTRSSRNGVRNALLAFYKSQGRRDGHPANDLPNLPEPFSLPRPVTETDYDVLIRSAHQLGGIHEAVGCLLGYTGCRISELMCARWHQFALGSNPLWRIEGKSSGRRGPKPRQVPISPSLLVVLTRWRNASASPDWVFPSDQSTTGHRGQTSLRQIVTEICQTAGVDRVTPHRYRHTVASLTLDRTRDVRAVQELLGHASLATTQRYTQVLPGRLRSLVETLEPAPRSSSLRGLSATIA